MAKKKTKEKTVKLDNGTRDEARDYAWNYFRFHAEQRLKTFNFYLIIATILSGGLITLLTSDTFPYRRWSSVLAFLLFFMSFIFWRLERRNRQLVDNGEEALNHLDAKWDHDVLKIFENDRKAMKNIHLIPKVGLRLRYSNCFNIVFFTFGLLGLVTGAIIILSNN